jgi:hypothetical protein
MRAKNKRFFLVFGFIILTLFINTFVQNKKTEVKFPKILYNIPTYENSRISAHLTSKGDPYIFVFLSNDKLDKIIKFYENKLKKRTKKITYRNNWLTIYQINLEKMGENIGLKNFISRGVEIIPLNSMHRKVYGARVKIKIIIPAWEIKTKSQKAQRQGGR